MLKAIELFAGAGGLGMGLDLVGFKPLAVVEWDRWACDTIRENKRRRHPLVVDWPLHERDVRTFDLSGLPTDIDLVAGGPPCQPFSIGGKHGAHGDERDMFPATVEVVRKLRPRAFIIENVKGLTRSSFANYFQYILLQFEFPEIVRGENESWAEHLARLQKRKTSGSRSGLAYNVVTTLVNAANYGVPQRRERVFIVGFRDDQQVRWSFPPPTHSHGALLVSQWVTGEYWDRHCRPIPTIPSNLVVTIDKLRKSNFRPDAWSSPWTTVRDALRDIPDPEIILGDKHFLNHRFQPGARSYVGHTGSPLDLPAKTLKAGDHGVPGGENMMVRDNGSVRYFSVREAARLQTFPDGYVLHGCWSEAMRQLGNAVPVALARVVASSVAVKLLERDFAHGSRPTGRA